MRLPAFCSAALLMACSRSQPPVHPVSVGAAAPELIAENSSASSMTATGGAFLGDQPAPLTAMEIISLENNGWQSISVAAGGEVWFDQPMMPTRAADGSMLSLQARWRLEFKSPQRAQVLVAMDLQTGDIGMGADEHWEVPTHIHCSIGQVRTVHCTSSSAHTPAYDVYWTIAGDGLISARWGATGQPAVVARVSPPPTDDLNAYQALFLLVSRQFEHDNHGDDAHDIDF